MTSVTNIFIEDEDRLEVVKYGQSEDRYSVYVNSYRVSITMSKDKLIELAMKINDLILQENSK